MRKKRTKKKRVPPGSYDTILHYFATEQVGIVKKMRKDGVSLLVD